MIELTQLKQFICIAEAGTISKAAELLHLSQPGLTRSIQRLESEMGVSLFDHKKNKITLNDTGMLALTYAKELLAKSDDMIQTLQHYEANKQVISIGSCAPAPIWGLSYLLQNLYPDQKQISELVRDEDQLIIDLKKQAYSLVVLHKPYEEEGYECIRLFEEHLYLSLSPAHPLAWMDHISYQDLNGESILLLSKIGFWNEICLKMLPQSHLLIQESNESFQELSRLSALPHFKSNITIAREPTQENRISIPISDEEAHATYYAVFRKSDHDQFAQLESKIATLDWSLTVS